MTRKASINKLCKSLLKANNQRYLARCLTHVNINRCKNNVSTK